MRTVPWMPLECPRSLYIHWIVIQNRRNALFHSCYGWDIVLGSHLICRQKSYPETCLILLFGPCTYLLIGHSLCLQMLFWTCGLLSVDCPIARGSSEGPVFNFVGLLSWGWGLSPVHHKFQCFVQSDLFKLSSSQSGLWTLGDYSFQFMGH